jgi:ssDNA thymidine ADP-ribosyltransferase, DarT
MSAPPRPKIYHILHEDRLPSIVGRGRMLCHAQVIAEGLDGTNIGMNGIKQRRLTLALTSRPGLMVGACVPFYFCPRSVMLFLIHRANHPELTYTGGQGPIVHLEADLLSVVAWANQNNARWAFALSNAGSNYFEDRADLSKLDEIDWSAVTARQWAGVGVPASVKEGKQAEFLLEAFFPWSLVERIGVLSQPIAQRVANSLRQAAYRPPVVIRTDWYY